MRKLLIVTAADQSYADLLEDLVQSLAVLRTTLAFEVACFDLGLEPETATALRPLIEHMAAPRWPFAPDARFDREARWLARAVRPFIARQWPGYDIYLWLDADAWVQELLALETLITAADEHGMAVVSTAHPAYTHNSASRSWLFQRYCMALGPKLAEQLMSRPYINGGVWALRGDTPHWEAWENRFRAALPNWSGDFLSDQALLNALVYLDGLPAQFLPARCNWICHLALPVLDAERGLLCTPDFPFPALGIVHNTWNNKRRAWPIGTPTGELLEMPLTYRGVRDMTAKLQRRR